MLKQLKTANILVSLYNAPKTNISTTKFISHLKLGRYDKPIGSILLLQPCIWGTILGQPTFDFNQILYFGAVFGVGSFAMRAAGCIVNDLWDKDIDGKVLRTQQRPLASGELRNNQAFTSLFLHLTVGLGVLTQINQQAIIASFSIVPIVAIYPLMKKYFKYPQLVLGIAMNWGIIVGGLQVGTFSMPLLLVYLGSIFQTIMYDTIYAHQDKNYDQKLGLYSTAYTLPYNSPYYLSIPFTLSLAAASYLLNYHPLVYPALFAVQIGLLRQIQLCEFDNPDDCAHFFKKFGYVYQSIVCLILGLGSYYKNQK